MILILLGNIAFGGLTAGMYAFWGHARLRRYLWQHLRVGNERLTYTGTGRELFLRTLAALAIALPLALLPWLLHGAWPAWLALAAASIILRPTWHFVARRHLFTRTRLLDVPFGIRPRMVQYLSLSVVGTLLSLLSLGALWPLAIHDRYDFLVSHTTWGNKSLRYTGRAGEFTRLCWRGFSLCLLTLGLYTPWFIAQVRRYRGKHTHIDEAHLFITVTGSQLLALFVTNAVLFLLTLGLATPWALARSLALQARTTQVRGYIDLGTVSQTAAEAASVLDALNITGITDL